MCHLPWVGMDISPQGEFKPCCKYTDVLAKDLDEFLTSPMRQKMQEDFLAGREHEGCARCWRDEAAGLPSKRELDNQYIFEKQTPEYNGIKVLGMTFGNTCNLACRTCSSYASSRWRHEANAVKDRLPELTRFGHNQFYRSEQFINKLLSNLKGVRHIEFAGGEPFFADPAAHHQILTHIINNEDASQISLHYITNLTKMPSPDTIKFHWSHFKKVDVQLSIDGIYKKFEYMRWPGRWTSVTLNLARYKELKRLEGINLQLSISHTVSMLNVFDLPEFLEWCELEQLPIPYLGLVTRPDIYSITVLPKEAKERIEQHFNRYGKYQELLDPIVHAMWAKDDSELLDNTIKHVKILDTKREQSFAETFKNTYNLLGERCQTLYQLY